MEKRPRNKFVLILLALSVLAFLSISIIPIVSSLISPPAQNAGQVSSGPVASAEVQRLEEQESGYKSVLDREPENETALRGLFETRAQLIQQGKRTPKDLVEPLQKLKAKNPEQKDFALLLAQTYQQSGDREQAAKTYRELLTKSPADLDALQGLVALFLNENQAASAVELLDKTIREQSNTSGFDKVGVELLLGDVYTSQGKYDKALTLYDELLSDKPEDFRVNLGKAIALKSQGKAPEAKSWFKKATDLAPAQFKDRIRQIAKEPQITTPPTSDAGGESKP